MDPLTIVAVVVVAGALTIWASRPSGRRTVELGQVVDCRLSPQRQAQECARRNRVMLALEEKARRDGLVGPELFGIRMAAITRVPDAVRAAGVPDDR